MEIPLPTIAKKATKKAAPMKAAKAPALKLAKKARARKVVVKAPAKEAAKAISAPLKKRRGGKEGAGETGHTHFGAKEISRLATLG